MGVPRTHHIIASRSCKSADIVPHMLYSIFDYKSDENNEKLHVVYLTSQERLARNNDIINRVLKFTDSLSDFNISRTPMFMKTSGRITPDSS